MLTSLQNPLVKQLRKLQTSKERRESGLFLVEGTHPIEAALQHGWVLEAVLVTESWSTDYPALREQLAVAARRFELVHPAVLAAVAETVTPAGVVAAVRRQERPWTALVAGTPSLLVLGEQLQDPGNVGTIVRSCAAVAADGLLLSAESVEPDHPKLLRATAGLWFRNPPLRCPDLGEVVEALLHRNVQVLAADAGGELTHWQCDFTRPTAFVLGSEGQGLSEKLLAAIPARVRIPLAPEVESLNVAVTAALLLFEAARQRQDQTQ